MTIALVFLAPADGRRRRVAVAADRQRAAVAGAGRRGRRARRRSWRRPAAKIGLWVFLAVATSLFALFISAYAMRMDFGGLEPAARAAAAVAEHGRADRAPAWRCNGRVRAARRGRRDSVRTRPDRPAACSPSPSWPGSCWSGSN